MGRCLRNRPSNFKRPIQAGLFEAFEEPFVVAHDDEVAALFARPASGAEQDSQAGVVEHRHTVKVNEQGGAGVQ